MKKQPREGARKRARALRREMTEAEKKIWRLLRLGQVDGFRFRRQVPIGRYITDFVCHKAKLIIEVDGGQHDPSSEQERGRTRFLESEGYRILRFWNNEVLENLEGVQAVIIEFLQRAHPHPNPPPSRGRADRPQAPANAAPARPIVS